MYLERKPALGHDWTTVPIERLTPQRRRELTRNALVEAAAEVFARRGFHGASLEEIAETAGFTRGAIYSNFRSKEDLLLAVADLVNRKHIAAFTAAQEEATDQEARRTGAAAAAVWRDVIGSDPNLVPLTLEFQLYALRNPAFRERLATLDRQQMERIANLIERESAAFGITLKLPALDLAHLMNATVMGLSEKAGVDVDNAERYARLAEEFFQLMADAIVDRTDD